MSAMTHLFWGVDSLPTQALLVFGVCVTSAWRIWMSYRKMLVQEKERTSRLLQSIAGAEPLERPEIIRAFSLLDGRPALRPADQEPPGTERPKAGRQPVLSLRLRPSPRRERP
jgi:hypothetical protein